MKLRFWSILLVNIPLLSAAQINRNQVIWTASLKNQFSYGWQDILKHPVNNLVLNAEASFLIRDGLAVGGILQGAWNNDQYRFDSDGNSRSDQRYQISTLTPFLRKYWKVAPFIVYVGGGIDLSLERKVSSQTYAGAVQQEYSYQNHQITPSTQAGLLYPITNRLGLQIAARSSLFPISFNSLQLGLIIYAGGETNGSYPATTKPQYPLVRNRWLLSGTFRSEGSKGTNNDGKTRYDYQNSGTSIDLAAGLFVRNRLVVGTGIYVGARNGVQDSSQAVSYYARKPLLIGIRPYVKKYLTDTRLTPYLQAHVSYNRVITGDPATNTVYGGGEFGLAYLLGKNWLIEGKLLGLTASYSLLPTIETDIAFIAGMHRLSANLDAGFQPAFTLTYVFD